MGAGASSEEQVEYDESPEQDWREEGRGEKSRGGRE